MSDPREPKHKPPHGTSGVVVIEADPRPAPKGDERAPAADRAAASEPARPSEASHSAPQGRAPVRLRPEPPPHGVTVRAPRPAEAAPPRPSRATLDRSEARAELPTEASPLDPYYPVALLKLSMALRRLPPAEVDAFDAILERTLAALDLDEAGFRRYVETHKARLMAAVKLRGY